MFWCISMCYFSAAFVCVDFWEMLANFLEFWISDFTLRLSLLCLPVCIIFRQFTLHSSNCFHSALIQCLPNDLLSTVQFLRNYLSSSNTHLLSWQTTMICASIELHSIAECHFHLMLLWSVLGTCTCCGRGLLSCPSGSSNSSRSILLCN